MKKYLLLVLLVVYSITGYGQTTNDTYDTAYNVNLKEVRVTAKFLNDTDRYRYNQTKFYVTTILPYLNASTKLFKEINAKVQNDDLSRKARKEFVNSKEDEMRGKFEDKVKDLNVTQGVLLVKLIARQTDVNIYHILKEFKNPLTAVKWQGWARLHGLNLDKRYHPEDEPMLENIMEELGYPLPGSYAVMAN